ncbi:hypothetical protein [Curvibacter lanceolatus]|uniref:hypothetical protein n=1 Tax=Curvibacter lanceolatus TaxID=86182 RepID=UPI0012FB0C87|nr:hypothetical protein [Curvibacter lanceolatus]
MAAVALKAELLCLQLIGLTILGCFLKVLSLMKSVSIKQLVDFYVDIAYPPVPIASGIRAAKGGNWLFSAVKSRPTWSGYLALPKDDEFLSVVDKIIVDLEAASSISKFKSLMTIEDYRKFAFEYYQFVSENYSNYWDETNKELIPIFSKLPDENLYSCWIPVPWTKADYSGCEWERKFRREGVMRQLKEMCLDVELLNPYFRGDFESFDSGVLTSEGGFLFMANMGLVVVDDECEYPIADASFCWELFSEDFCKARAFIDAKRIIKNSRERGVSLVVSKNLFFKLFGYAESEVYEVKELPADKMVPLINSKKWSVKPWGGSAEIKNVKGKLKAVPFRDRTGSKFVHTTLEELWAAGAPFPTVDSLLECWYARLDGKDFVWPLRRDPENHNLLIVLDSKSERNLNDSQNWLDKLIDKFVILSD